MVHFDPMEKGEFPSYWKYVVESWMSDMQRAGLIKEDITYKEAEDQVRSFRPDGMGTSGHHFMHVVSEDERVGAVWYEIRDKVVIEAYLWDIVINEKHRGSGYGRQTMEELEAAARKEGAVRISLNVFGSNRVARTLYTGMGYQDATITMMKYL